MDLSDLFKNLFRSFPKVPDRVPVRLAEGLPLVHGSLVPLWASLVRTLMPLWGPPRRPLPRPPTRSQLGAGFNMHLLEGRTHSNHSPSGLREATSISYFFSNM